LSVNTGVRFVIASAAKSDVPLVGTSVRLSSEYCIVGGFYLRGGDFLEKDSQQLPLSFLAVTRDSNTVMIRLLLLLLLF
jgi:hypothetical protein